MHDAAPEQTVSEKPAPPSPTPASPATPALEYEQRNTTISRRQYRVLLTLTLLNTILLAGFVAGPVFLPFAKQQWQQFQTAREQRRRDAARQAAYAQALNYSIPADQVVLDEIPETAAKRLGETSAYAPVASDVPYFAPRPWQPPVTLAAPPFWKELNLGDRGVVFIHGLKDPAGNEQLVWVYVNVEQRTNGASQLTTRRQYYLQTQRQITAMILGPDGKSRRGSAMRLQLGRENWMSTVTWTKGASDWEHGRVEYNVKDLFRIYAGKLDPSDPSRFTIDYDIDGDHHGTIDGRLVAADRVELTPREGAIVDKDAQGRNLVWDPHVAPIKH
jgi:hypothetical protein